MVTADALSCQPDHIKDNQDNELVALLPNKVWISALAVDLTEDIKCATALNTLASYLISK